MDLLPKANREILRYINLINKDPIFLNLLGYLKYTLYLSPLIFLCTMLILKRRQDQALKETFKHSGFYQIFKNEKFKRNYFTNENSNNLSIDHLHKFQKKRMCYRKPSGIHNYGNNCYMNSLLQVKIYL